MQTQIEENNYRNRFLCRNCKKTLISKEALDNHIIGCYESKIEKILDLHKNEKEELIKQYEEKIDDTIEYFIKHVDIIEKKHLSINNYLLGQIKKLAKLSNIEE